MEEQKRKLTVIHKERIISHNADILFIVNTFLTMKEMESIANILSKADSTKLNQQAKKIAKLLSRKNRGKRKGSKTNITVVVERELPEEWWTVKIIVYHKNSKKSPAV